MDFEKICMIFTMQEPYYGILLSSMDRRPDPRIQTIGVARVGNVFKLHYNPSFMDKLDIDTACLVLRHEILHVAFHHFNLWDDIVKPSPDVHRLRNIAADMEVNSYLDTGRIRGINPVKAEDEGWEKYLGTREYYSRLYNKAVQEQEEREQKGQAKQPDKPCNGGQGGQEGGDNPDNKPDDKTDGTDTGGSPVNGGGQSPDGGGNDNQPSSPNPQPDLELSDEFKESHQVFDDHSMWPEGMTGNEKEQLAQAIDDILVQAAEECEKSRGTIPSEMRVLIGKIKSKRPKPVCDWRRYFRRYIGNEFSELVRKSKKRESRRFPDAAGNRKKRKSHILVAIDTSGSICMPDYREFFGQIKNLSQSATFHVVECDTDIRHEYDFNGHVPEETHGGGGTSFEPVVDMFNENRKKYDALVYFTDGCCTIPKSTPKETLWVVSSNGDQTNRNKYKVNGSSVVFIKKQK